MNPQTFEWVHLVDAVPGSFSRSAEGGSYCRHLTGEEAFEICVFCVNLCEPPVFHGVENVRLGEYT